MRQDARSWSMSSVDIVVSKKCYCASDQCAHCTTSQQLCAWAMPRMDGRTMLLAASKRKRKDAVLREQRLSVSAESLSDEAEALTGGLCRER